MIFKSLKGLKADLILLCKTRNFSNSNNFKKKPQKPRNTLSQFLHLHPSEMNERCFVEKIFRLPYTKKNFFFFFTFESMPRQAGVEYVGEFRQIFLLKKTHPLRPCALYFGYLLFFIYYCCQQHPHATKKLLKLLPVSSFSKHTSFFWAIFYLPSRAPVAATDTF